jgi:hypothetical protein
MADFLLTVTCELLCAMKGVGGPLGADWVQHYCVVHVIMLIADRPST